MFKRSRLSAKCRRSEGLKVLIGRSVIELPSKLRTWNLSKEPAGLVLFVVQMLVFVMLVAIARL